MSGRKRHLLVDTQGFVLKAVVHPANLHDRDGGRLVLEALQPVAEQFPRLRHLWVDAGYRGKFVDWVEEAFGWSVEVVQHWWTGVSKVWVFPGQEPPTIPAGFQLLPHRWLVERTLAWLGRYRRLSKDYEYLPTTGEAWIYAGMSWLLVRRLAKTPK